MKGRVTPMPILMTTKNKTRLLIGAWLVPWIVGLWDMHTPLWRALWFCLAVIHVGAYRLLYRTDIDTEAGLERVSTVLLGLVCLQIAAVIFIAFQAAGKN
jgi:hypothetical protein